MKKLLCFLTIASLVATSCSSSDEESAVLLKSTVNTSSGGAVTTQTATYNGTKISTITGDDGFVSYFTYTGDLITKREYKSGEILILTELFSYDDNQRLTTYKRLDHENNLGRREVYLHADDGTIYGTVYDGDLVSQDHPINYVTITFIDGEIDTIARSDDDRTYTYDNKNNPFRNITGYGKISWVGAAAQGITRNITSESFGGSPGTTTTYTYNGDGYPVHSAKAYSGGGEATTDYIYY